MTVYITIQNKRFRFPKTKQGESVLKSIYPAETEVTLEVGDDRENLKMNDIFNYNGN
jgi:hypothetical protein